jgi:hypothetical protein
MDGITGIQTHSNRTIEKDSILIPKKNHYQHHDAYRQLNMSEQQSSGVATSILQLSKLVRDMCPPTPADKSERIMSELDRILSQSRVRSDSSKQFLEQVMNIMYRYLDFSELAVAIKDPGDGQFRYIAFMGMRKDAENAYRKLSYNTDDVFSQSKYPRIKCTTSVDFFPSELRPEKDGEIETFNRPGLLRQHRISLEMLQEGDYFCAYLQSQRGDLLGWFDLARTKDGKFPSGNTLRWLNLICTVVGKVIA